MSNADPEDKDTFTGGVVVKPEVMPSGSPMVKPDDGSLSRAEVRGALRRNGVDLDVMIKKGLEGLEASTTGKDELGATVEMPLWGVRFKFWSAFMEMFGALNVKSSSVEVNNWSMTVEQRTATLNRLTKIMGKRVKASG